MTESDLIKTVFLIILLILIVIFAPLATIWSLNTLFGLTIAYDIWSWLAAVWLSSVTFGGIQASVRAKTN